MRARCPSEDEETLVYDKSGASSSRNIVAAGVLFEELVRQLAVPPLLRPDRPPLPPPRILHVHPSAEPPPLPRVSGGPPPLPGRAGGPPPLPRRGGGPPPLPREALALAIPSPSQLTRTVVDRPPVQLPPPHCVAAADDDLRAALSATDEVVADRRPRRASRLKVPSLVFVMSVGLGFGLGVDSGTRSAITSRLEATAHAAMVAVQR